MTLRNIEANTMDFYIAQGISVLTALTAIVGMQMKNMKAILLSQILANLFTASTYFLLDGFSGAGICLVAIAQAVTRFFYNQKNKKPQLWVIILFISLYIGCSVVYYKTFIDVFSALAAVCYAMSIAQSNPKRSRLWYVLNPLFWVVYDINTRAYGNLIMHASIFLSTLLVLIRVDGIFSYKNKTSHGAEEEQS